MLDNEIQSVSVDFCRFTVNESLSDGFITVHVALLSANA